MKTKFWMVWNPADRAPRYQHHSLEKAKKEAERLANLHPSQTFVVLESVGEVKVQNTVWTEHQDELPF